MQHFDAAFVTSILHGYLLRNRRQRHVLTFLRMIDAIFSTCIFDTVLKAGMESTFDPFDFICVTFMKISALE